MLNAYLLKIKITQILWFSLWSHNPSMIVFPCVNNIIICIKSLMYFHTIILGITCVIDYINQRSTKTIISFCRHICLVGYLTAFVISIVHIQYLKYLSIDDYLVKFSYSYASSLWLLNIQNPIENLSKHLFYLTWIELNYVHYGMTSHQHLINYNITFITA